VIRKLIIRPNEYYDSIQLMQLSEKVRALEGLKQAFVAMSTPSNKQILEELEFHSEALDNASAGDMFIAIEAETSDHIESSLEYIENLLKQRMKSRSGKSTHRSFAGALRAMPDANVCVISVPGEFAFFEAEKALNNGLHVLVYSDNVPLHQDRKLKELAIQKGLLCMGPDCGVANINGAALMTASVAKKGSVGIVGASGSGTQQIAVLCDKEGVGVSQAIGVGGKDLADEVGGIEMLFGIDVLEKDPETKVIILVSRTPGEQTLKKIMGRISECHKPIVVYFIGGDQEMIEKSGALSASDLEEAALKAVDVVRGREPRVSQFSLSSSELQQIIHDETKDMASEQKYLRGLYCGGTFCEEAMSLLTESIGDTFSNAPLKAELKLQNSMESKGNTVIDLGDEEFTLGRPHPVIDPDPVRRAVLREAENKDVALYLMDFILGPAIHPDPAGAVIEEIKEAKEKFKQAGGYLSVVASVCGTDGDPQNLTRQEATLRDAGVVVLPSNAQASRVAGFIVQAAATRS